MAVRKRRFSKNRLADLVVKRKLRPGVRLALVGGAVVALLGASVLIYDHGLTSAGFDRAAVAREKQELQEEADRLKTENQELRESLARAQLALQMNQTAYGDLNRSLDTSSQEIVKLREELNFYRNIISPAGNANGVQIQRLDISRGDAENHYRYKLVLIQAMQSKRTITGRVRFEIKGEQEGKETLVRFPEANERQIAINFRYFQDVEGQLQLPKNFRPQQIKVHVSPGNAQPVEQNYAWPGV